MPPSELANEAGRLHWNDDYWLSIWPKREQLTGAVTDVLLRHLRLAAGEQVLDVGSGGGTASVAAGRLVGAKGWVVGADISVPLVQEATLRAHEVGLDNVRFVVADVQCDTIEGAPFDVVMSQFGVMFFDEPTTAFVNIGRHAKPGGRLGFACWQPADRNPWHVNTVIARYIRQPPAPAPGKGPTGPFSLGDSDRAIEALAAAGWSGIERTPYELTVAVDRDALFDQGQLVYLGVPDAQLDEAGEAVARHLEGLRNADGSYDAPLAFQIFTAHR